MADKSRSIQTKFWKDPWIETLNPNEKLLYLYILTNPQTNLLGIYEVSLGRISYESGLTEPTIQKCLERFGNDSKALYNDNFIIIPNFLKNQNLNTNMQVNVEHLFEALPKWLKNSILGNGSEGLGNGYETIRNGLLKVKGKVKGKEKKKSGNINIPFSSFWNLYEKKVGKTISTKMWNNLTDEERTLIMNYIPQYKQVRDKHLRRDPERFFKYRVWEDEIVGKGKIKKEIVGYVYICPECKKEYKFKDQRDFHYRCSENQCQQIPKDNGLVGHFLEYKKTIYKKTL